MTEAVQAQPLRAVVYRSDPGIWCAELRLDGEPFGVVGWRYASTWRRALLFAEIGLRRGDFPDHPMSGERWPAPERRADG